MRSLRTGVTDQTIVVHCFDVDGAAVTLTSGSAGLAMSYRLDTAGREGTPVSMTPVARLVAGTHRDGAITSKGDGKHEIDLPDAAFASAGYLTVILSATSVTGRVYSEILAVGITAELDSSARVTLAASQPDYDLPTNTELNAALAASDDATLAAIAALATPADVNAQVLDVLSVDTFAELSAPPAATSSLKDKITWLFMYARNRVTQTALARTLYRDDTTTVAGTSATSDNGTTFTKGEDA
jgi:hypothetical protein